MHAAADTFMHPNDLLCWCRAVQENNTAFWSLTGSVSELVLPCVL